eukprot:Gregarina_sp_Pseudo_9__373@NODE_1241_length_1747_cov_117_612412_g1167_i0_p1_GENE_NODE_1241_length_1747_cov_117_612412_g1167_i0NODE_1241_length_1747_cov_117_612412_g1167_i0_p1_ORF_typecomplete_len411_score76_92zfCCCH/PF00642_24/0_028zfCCCH/PF00642_24/0_00091zfCCCH_3/PF15663_5/2_3e05Torus/PF16131_5/4_3Torus/PF16131_5/2_8Torus/PF16131_5/8e03_NODE_1241_length_1747_cov_117_612412_g1167_i0301262
MTSSSVRSPSPHINHSRCGSSTLLRQLTADHASPLVPPPPDKVSGLLPNDYVARANSLASNIFCSQPSGDAAALRCRQTPFSLLVNLEDAEGDEGCKSVKNPRGQQRKRFFKTRLCPYHFKKGSACKGGVHCSYAHSFSELRPSVDLTKTKLCHDYLSGLCHRKADECPFAHGSTELRPVRPTVDGCLLTLPDNPYGRCATANELSSEAATRLPLDRAQTFETHATVDANRYLSSAASLMETPAMSGSGSRFLASPTAAKDSLLPAGSKSTDTAISTQSSGPLFTPRTRHNLASLSDHQASQLLASLSTSSPQTELDHAAADERYASNSKSTDTGSPAHRVCYPETRAPPETATLQAAKLGDMFANGVPAEDEPKLTLTVSQLANIILAAHSAESPADLVNDVLSYIYKT